jgi:hypothetical protein
MADPTTPEPTNRPPDPCRWHPTAPLLDGCETCREEQAQLHDYLGTFRGVEYYGTLSSSMRQFQAVAQSWRREANAYWLLRGLGYVDHPDGTWHRADHD